MSRRAAARSGRPDPPRAGALAGLGVIALLGLLPGTGLGVPAPGVGPGAAFTVSVSASPSQGTPPLQVAFQATVSQGSPTEFRWSFGDGGTLNTTAASGADPVHEYVSPGVFHVSVNVSETGGSAQGTSAVYVGPAPLTVAIFSSRSNGSVPLDVHFVGSATGGSGTYVRFAWDLGDGTTASGPIVNHTFPAPGEFSVALRVTDSDGVERNASISVNATAALRGSAPAHPATAAATPFWRSWLFWMPTTAVVAVGSLGVVVGFRRRFRRRTAPHDPAFAPAGALSEAPPAPDAAAPAEVLLDRPARSPPTPVEEARRATRRILVHLLGLGRYSSNEIPEMGRTQRGIGEALGIRQNLTSNLLRRLISAGMVEAETSHVRGASRRVKVYRLTSRGEVLAGIYRREAIRANGEPTVRPADRP